MKDLFYYEEWFLFLYFHPVALGLRLYFIQKDGTNVKTINWQNVKAEVKLMEKRK